jgi:hypothetical protein
MIGGDWWVVWGDLGAIGGDRDAVDWLGHNKIEYIQSNYFLLNIRNARLRANVFSVSRKLQRNHNREPQNHRGIRKNCTESMSRHIIHRTRK